MLPNGLKLFVADVVDEETNEQEYFYVVGKTYDSSLKRFIKWADSIWWRYAYYFNEVTDKSEIESFKDEYANVKAGIYMN